MNSTGTAQAATLIQAGQEANLIVTTTNTGWIEIRNNPERQLDPNAKLDFLRLVWEDDDYWSLYQLSHNGLHKGTATFSGSMVGAMYSTITNYFEGL